MRIARTGAHRRPSLLSDVVAELVRPSPRGSAPGYAFARQRAQPPNPTGSFVRFSTSLKVFTGFRSGPCSFTRLPTR